MHSCAHRVNERGEKKILAIKDGVRESTQSWREVFFGCKGRGMNEPKLAGGWGSGHVECRMGGIPGDARAVLLDA